jgi:hypothetical protein
MLEDVVTQKNGHRLSGGEMSGKSKRLCDPSFPFLVGIAQVFQTELTTVPKEPKKVSSAPTTRHDKHVIDPSVSQLLEWVIDHRPIVDRKEVLVGDARHREKTRA